MQETPLSDTKAELYVEESGWLPDPGDGADAIRVLIAATIIFLVCAAAYGIGSA